jgi:hypothetical protein
VESATRGRGVPGDRFSCAVAVAVAVIEKRSWTGAWRRRVDLVARRGG